MSDKKQIQRRDFLEKLGLTGLGIAAMPAISLAEEKVTTPFEGEKKVVILLDTETHMMPALAKEMA